jgi:hypothetical protein
MADDPAWLTPEVRAFIDAYPTAPAKPLDAAIAAGPAIDRAADGKADLRVLSPFEKEAERLKLAKYFTEKGTQ